MNNKKLILHIGCAKTGTTSIQKTLKKNRARLAENGILFPKSPGQANHVRLVVAAQDDDVIDNIKLHNLSNTGLTIHGFREHLRDLMQQEFHSSEPWHTIVLSTELIHCRLTRPSEINRLFALFKEYVSKIEVVLFLRRQDDLAVSRFSSSLRAGHKNFNDVFGNIGANDYVYPYLPHDRKINDYEDYYNFKNLIQRFQPHVPDENIKVCLYSDMIGASSSVESFVNLSGIPLSLIHHDSHSLNTAMSAESQYVMSQVNQSLNQHLSTGLRNQKAKELHLRIEKEFPGKRRQVSRFEAESFLEKFEDSNEWVRKKFFPEQETLFKLDFSKYPEIVDYSRLPKQMEKQVEHFVKIAKLLSS